MAVPPKLEFPTPFFHSHRANSTRKLPLRMRSSRHFISTIKEVPADAELVSHKLMLRAGMIRRLAAGIYTWTPAGLRVVRKIEAIVREEMNRAGATELSMPVVQPAELWQESGRWQGGRHAPARSEAQA